MKKTKNKKFKAIVFSSIVLGTFTSAYALENCNLGAETACRFNSDVAYFNALVLEGQSFSEAEETRKEVKEQCGIEFNCKLKEESTGYGGGF